MKEFIWQLSQLKNLELTEDFEQELHINPVLIPFLALRGISNVKQAKDFFTPKVSQLHSPFLMADLPKAVERINQAIEFQQKILVYGDYDVDGTTAVSIVYSFLRKLQCNVEYYVPDRYLEGYGVSMKGMQYAIDKKFDLIITLDCGIKANATIEYVSKHSIDVIVCDHHEPGDTLPNAFAVLDPKRKDCKYPFKELSGCGVGFKLLQGLCEKRNLPLKENLYCYIDVLAVSIASDIVPIIDENRVYMYYGLIKMKIDPRIGIEAIMQNAIVGNEITVSDIVFKIGPRINAAGRIKNAKTSVELLISEDLNEAVEICKQIHDYNLERRELDKQITKEALRLIERDTLSLKKVTNVVFKSGWKKGVIGIVASRIIETYYKPTIVFCGEGDIISGSARSVSDYDMYSALEKCADLLENFGGHKYAAGMTIKRENLEAFQIRFNDVVSQTILEEQLQQKILIDLELQPEDISISLYDQLQKFAPFGPENMTPVFMIKNLCDTGKTKPVGNDQSHMKFSLQSAVNNSYVTLDGIGFGLAEKWKEISKKSSVFDVCFVLRDNVFRELRTVQLEIRDIRVSE